MKERASPKQVTGEGDADRNDELRFRIDETIFAACDKAEMRKAKILVISISDFVNTSRKFFRPSLIMLAGTDMDCMQSTSM